MTAFGNIIDTIEGINENLLVLNDKIEDLRPEIESIGKTADDIQEYTKNIDAKKLKNNGMKVLLALILVLCIGVLILLFINSTVFKIIDKNFKEKALPYILYGGIIIASLYFSITYLQEQNIFL